MGREELEPEVTPEPVSSSTAQRATTLCPACQVGTCAKCGSKVPPITLASLLTDAARARLSKLDGFRFCGSQSCETVYWNAETGESFTKKDLRVRVGLKETVAPRPVCYCFGFSVEDIEAQVSANGTSTIQDEITEKVRQKLCHCEDANPQGTCCLGNVRAALKVAQERHGSGKPIAPGATPLIALDDPIHACCAASNADATACPLPSAKAKEGCCTVKAAPQDTVSRAGVLSSLGAVLSAVLASACCWLPLLLIAFGASAASVSGFFEQYRLVFLGSAAGLLGLGFYFVYFRKEACGPDGSCAVPNPRLKRLNQVVLWVATLLVVLAGAFPSYVGALLGSGERTTNASSDQLGARAIYAIKGMTCEACAVTIRAEIEKLPGIATADVSFERKQATVVAAKGSSPPSDDDVITAIRRAGYQAERITQEGGR